MIATSRAVEGGTPRKFRDETESRIRVFLDFHVFRAERRGASCVMRLSLVCNLRCVVGVESWSS
jgi:hypothetical protein